MLRIEIVNTEVHTFEGKRKSDGQAFSIKRQDAYLHTGNHYPDRFDIELPKDAKGDYKEAYAPGFYTVDPSSFRVNGEYKRLELNPFAIVLTPLPAADAASARKPADKAAA